ncbi:RHS repeat domain-containing protein [Paenibacillus sonchi]|uniref:RHS repeat domain-containing protein n=1 Tax=Paenibacillus sonchi TaxID=373687 RepID=UPI001E286A88|nr:RHS repeat-associated core domain-containing protein [Paenibacillus sonchi]MCE3203467.1 RHS repeat protein [Paenibacillus sonchi]
MKNNSFLSKLFLIILSITIMMPNYHSSATGIKEETLKTTNDNIESAVATDSQTSLTKTNHRLQDVPSVANSVYDSGFNPKIERIKAMTLQRTSKNKAKQALSSKSSKSTLRDLTKEEIDHLFLSGAGKEDVYWVNLLIKDSNLTPDKIFQMKKNGGKAWEDIQKQLLNEEMLPSTVEEAVYDEVLKSVSVEETVYTENKLPLNTFSKSISTFDAMVNSAFDSLITQQMINQTNKPQYADDYGSSESIDPVSGSLTWKENEISLPGRDGLDLNIGVMYNSNQSFVYMRDSSSNGMIKKYNYLISRYDLGIGWSFQFPSVQSADGYLFYHDGQGAVYRVDFNASDSLGSYTHLAGYQGKNLQFNQDNGTFNNGQVSSTYCLQYDDQKREYFASDGRLLGIVDRYGNTITFQHIDRVTYDGETNKVISSITDSLHRIVNFTYDTNLNTPDTFTGEKITVSVNTNGTETEKVVFTKSRSPLTFNGNPDGYAPILNIVTNQIGESTYFGYDSSVFAKFNYYQKNIDSNAGNNSYLRLTNVSYPNSSTSYQYELITRNLGPYGVGEEYRITSRNDTINSSYNKENYTYTGDYTGYPLYQDISYLPSTYTFSSIKTLQSTSATNGLATTMVFNGQSQNILTSTLAANGERKESRNTAFHSVFNYLPTQTTYAELAAGGTDSTGNLLYSEVSYTDWGALQSETKQLTSAQLNDADTKSKYTTTYTYEPNFHLLNSKSWFQNSTTLLTESYSYNEYGRVKTYTNPKNETTNYFYENIPGDVRKVSKIIIEKPMDNGLVSRVTTTYGSQYNYGFPTEEVSDFTNISATGQKTASSTKKQISYDMGSGKVIEVTDAADKKTKYTYDQLGRVITITYPTVTNLNGVQYDSEDQFTYTRDFAISSIFDAQNKGTYYLRVNSKRKYTQKSNGAVTYLSNKNSYYDGFGSLRLEQILDTGAVTQYHLDDLGRAVYVIDPVGNTTTVSFDAWGEQIEATDSFGNLHVTQNNKFRRQIDTYIVEASNVAAYRSNPTAALRTSYKVQKYDQWKQVISNAAYVNWPSLFPMVMELYRYDIAGNIIGYTDPNNNLNSDGVTTKFTYDTLNRLTSVKDALDQITNYQYDRNGQITQTTVQANASSTPVVLKSKEYNELGMLINKKDASSQNENKTYNTLGLLQKGVDRNSTVFDYQYDETQQLVRSTLTGNGGNIQKSSFILGSDGIKNNKNELVVNGVTSSQTTTIDSIQRVSTISSTSTGYSASAGYVYDKANRTTQFKSTLNGVGSFYTNYQYSKTRLDKVQTDGQTTLNGAATVNASYEYFPNGQIKTITYPTLADGRILRTTYTYDGLNRMYTMKNTINTSELSSYLYVYDFNGNITLVEETLDNGLEKTKKTTGYTYDKLNRLIGIKRSDGGTTQYTYDLQGNRQTVTDIGTIPNEIADTSFTYDLQNTLIGVTKNSSTISFNYLPSNLRYQKKKDAVTTQYNYNSSGQVISETRSDGQKANYIRGDRLLVKKDVTGAQDYYYLYNGHGDVVQILNNVGAVVNSYAYDAWGNITNQTEGIRNSFKYSGEMYDEETGLYYLRARYYDPGIGRFLNEDTYEGQIDNPLSLNLYTYVHNNPLIYSDPSGHRIAEDKYWSKADQKLIDKYTAEFNKAKAAGNTAAMQAAHDKAITIRVANGAEVIARTDYSTGKTTSISTGKGGVHEDFVTEALTVPVLAFGIYSLTATTTLTIGTEISGLGTVVEAPGQTITSISSHALKRAAARGVNQELMEQTVAKPLLVLEQEVTDTYFYLSKDAVVVLNKAGKVVTTYGKQNFDKAIKALLKVVK